MWWKIYFWIIIILTPIGAAYVYNGKVLTILDWADVAFCITALLALYSYIYKKTVFRANIWELIFWANVIYIAFWVLYYFTPLTYTLHIPATIMSRSYIDGATVIMDIFLSIPIYYALYQLGFSKKSKK